MQNVVLKVGLRTPNRSKADRLEALRDTFTACVRFHLDRIKALKTTNATTIHHDCYRRARELFWLPSATLQQAREKAIAAYRGYTERSKRDRRAQPPTFRRPLPLRLAVKNLKLFADKSVIRITTRDGYLWLPIVIPDSLQADIRRPFGVSEIIRRGDRWFLLLNIKREDVPARDGGPHFGVDLGLANLAVLAGPEIVRFFDGKPLRYVRGRYFRYRQALQSKRKIGLIKRSKGRESRWATNENHRVSRQIVDIVAAAGGTLHVERLIGIRERTKGTAKVRRMLHSWPFGQLLDFVRYKAKLAGVRVIEDDPRHTSQRCSRCGHTDRGNRPRQDRFKCKACGYESHADLNAARNLAAKGACSFGVGGATPPGCSDIESGERDGPRAVPDNRDPASSL